MVLTGRSFPFRRRCSAPTSMRTTALVTLASSTTVCLQRVGCMSLSLRPFAYLPIEDPELAADVASQLDNNWAGAVAGTELGLLSYASERYDVLWQTLSVAKLPLFIHPGSSPDHSPRSFLSEQSAWQSNRDDDRRRQFDLRGRDAPFPGFERNSRSWRRLHGRLMWALAAGYDHQQTRYSKAGHATPRCGATLLCRQFGAFAKLSSDGDCNHWPGSDSSGQRLAISNGRPVSRT